MFDGEHNTERADNIFLTMYHLLHEQGFHLDHWTQESPKHGCYCIPGVLVHTHLSGHISRPPHCAISLANRDISHDCKKMYQIFQTLILALNDSTEAFATGSSANQHNDATVRFFESDTRVIERARLGVHSTEMSGNSTRRHADFTTVVILSVTVRLVSMFLFRCPGKSDLRSRLVTSAQCTQLTLERLDLVLHGGDSDGMDKKSRSPHFRSKMIPPPLCFKTD